MPWQTDCDHTWPLPSLARGHLAKIWPFLRQRYGDFLIQKPLSPDMQAFVSKYDAARPD